MKTIGREEEGAGGLAQAPQVQQGDDEEDAQAQRDGGSVEAGVGALERRHAGGDGDGDGEGVVDDERGGGHEADVRPEVGAGHGVGAAAARVGVDHLAV